MAVPLAGNEVSDSEARLRLALSSGHMAVWEIDIASGKVTPSPELNSLYGFPVDATPSMAEYRSRFGPGEFERARRLTIEAVARGTTRIEQEIKHIWPDGTVKWLMVRAEAAPPMRGAGRRAIGIAIDITERKAAEEALARSEHRLRLSQHAAGIASLEIDIASGMVIGSDNFWGLWGLSPRDSVHIGLLENIVVPEHSNIRSTDETRRNGAAAPRVEYRIKRPDTGEIRWLARQIEFERDEKGKPARMFGVIQDITERKLAEQRQALLTHELEHRIKNILAMVSAIASQTLRASDIESARNAFMARIRALSEAHDLLTSTRWTDASIEGVLHAVLGPHEFSRRVTLGGPSLKLNPKMALSLALAVNELATNAAKYGALSGEAGNVAVKWDVTAQSANGAAELVWTWAELGGPPVTPPERRGFGSVLIERVLAADFDGVVELDYAPEGLKATMKVPMARLPPQG